MKNRLFLILLFVYPFYLNAQTENSYCQYCFKFKANQSRKIIEISNTAAFPIREMTKSYDNLVCAASPGGAESRREEKLEKYAGWPIKDLPEIKDQCDLGEERRIERERIEWETREAARLKEEARLREIREKEEIRRAIEREKAAAEETAARIEEEKERKKNQTNLLLEEYEGYEKPSTIPDGWHLAEIVNDDGRQKQSVKLKIKENRVVARAYDYRPRYEKIVAVTGTVRNCKAIIQENGERYYAYFTPFIRNRNSRVTVPVQDERVLWWDDLDIYWRKVFAGKKRTSICW